MFQATLDELGDGVTVRAIALSLSRRARFAGLTPEPYSVAEHCVRGSYLVPPALAGRFLLHDAAERWMCDVQSGVKNRSAMDGYRAMEDHYLERVYVLHGLEEDGDADAAVKVADLQMRAAEAEVFFPWIDPKEFGCVGRAPLNVARPSRRPWKPKEAYVRYIARWREVFAHILEAPLWERPPGFNKLLLGLSGFFERPPAPL